MVAAIATVVAPLMVAVAQPAEALTCAAPYRFSASSNRVYVSGATTVATLSDILANCPSAPLQLVDAATHTWQLNADILVDTGATLSLHGSSAGGDVDVLRLRSGSAGALTDVASITAQYGTIDIKGVTVTSWDPATSKPDTNFAVPSGGVRGRAFIRALSFMEGTTARQSTMNIVDSDVGYLGYNAAESYGVAYKARGCGITTQDVCAALDVLGKQTGSRFHNSFMGTYTWGAQGMEFSNNEYDNNADYGLDTHDDSDFLLITQNKFHDNGNHGVICSQRCDHLTITNNQSYRNGIIPFIPPLDGDPTDNQVHGIMLHRGVTDSVVEGNTVFGQPNGGGIVIFDSIGNTVRGNTVRDNKFGLRFSVGTKGTLVQNNTVSNSSSYAVFAYKGTDTPVYTGTSGRPSDITFTNNIFNGSGLQLFKLQDSDRFTFTGGSVAGTLTKGPLFERSKSNVYDVSVVTPKGMTFTLRGTSSSKTSVTFRGMKSTAIKVSKDSFSTATFTG